jgi:hypothetical protein
MGQGLRGHLNATVRVRGTRVIRSFDGFAVVISRSRRRAYPDGTRA